MNCLKEDISYQNFSCDNFKAVHKILYLKHFYILQLYGDVKNATYFNIIFIFIDFIFQIKLLVWMLWYWVLMCLLLIFLLLTFITRLEKLVHIVQFFIIGTLPDSWVLLMWLLILPLHYSITHLVMLIIMVTMCGFLMPSALVVQMEDSQVLYALYHAVVILLLLTDLLNVWWLLSIDCKIVLKYIVRL